MVQRLLALLILGVFMGLPVAASSEESSTLGAGPGSVQPKSRVQPRQRAAVRSTITGQPAVKPATTPRPAGGRYAIAATRLPSVNDRVPRTLSFFHTHTRETLTVTFKRNGQYVLSELKRLNHFLRDSRNAEEVALDPRLFDILWLVRQRLGSTAPYSIVSAYRSPQTNAWLASVSSGVAEYSLHMRGQAIDVMLPGRTPGQVRAAATALGMGGVGYYPRTGFVHIDTGAVRYW